jgi:hypothetical protein
MPSYRYPSLLSVKRQLTPNLYSNLREDSEVYPDPIEEP